MNSGKLNPESGIVCTSRGAVYALALMRRLPLANHCEVPWDEMKGTDKVRLCASCASNVYDLSAMREIEARALILLFANDRLCITYRTDGNDEIVFAAEARQASVLRRLSTVQAQIGAGVVALTLTSSSGCAPAVIASSGSASQAAANTSNPANSDQPSAPARPQTLPLDSDYDRIPDAEDKCPYEPGLREDLGCPPPKGRMRPVRGNIEIADAVYFRYRDHKLVPAALPLLDEVAMALRHHPEIQQLELQGYASSNEPGAQLLSERRAQAVRSYLVAAAVAPQRLVAVGYGHVTGYPNDTLDKRQRNRRVDFQIVKRESCPAPAAK